MIRVRNMQVLGDNVLSDGETDISNKDGKKVTVFWSAFDVVEDGALKAKNITVAPKAEPKKEATADKK